MNQMLENKKRGSWSTYYFIMIKKTSKGGGRLPRRSVPDLEAASF